MAAQSGGSPLLPGQSAAGNADLVYLGSVFDTPERVEHRFRLGAGDSARELKWADPANSFWKAELHKDKLILLGTHSRLHTVSIVDTGSAKLLAFVICLAPDLSPDGRVLTFLQFHPASLERPGDLLLWMDLDEPLDAQRVAPRHAKDWIADAVGWGRVALPAGFRVQSLPLGVNTGIHIRGRRWNGNRLRIQGAPVARGGAESCTELAFAGSEVSVSGCR